MDIVVTDCTVCPFSYQVPSMRGWDYVCSRLDKMPFDPSHDFRNGPPPIPKKCPLRKGAITVTLKNGVK